MGHIRQSIDDEAGNSAAEQDFTAEVAEWIEAFDEVVAQDWEQGAELLRRCGSGRARPGCRRRAS